jgi:TonB family protein
MNKQGHEHWRLLFLLCFLLIVPYMFAQQADEKVYDKVEKMPQYPGGHDKLMKFLRIPLPASALMGHGVPGRVIIQFVVEKDGTVMNPKVVRSVDPYLDRDALKLFDRMPRWTPGEQGGQKVRVEMAVPVRGEFKEIIEKDKETNKGLVQKQRPLIFIDSMEVPLAIIDTLNPARVKEFKVLKGKEALDLYGQKGANGVVLITLKSGVELDSIIETVVEKIAVMLRKKGFDEKANVIYWLDGKQLSADEMEKIGKYRYWDYDIELKKEEVIHVILRTPFYIR